MALTSDIGDVLYVLWSTLLRNTEVAGPGPTAHLSHLFNAYTEVGLNGSKTHQVIVAAAEGTLLGVAGY